MEIVRTVLLDRVVDWHRAEIGLGKAKGGRPARGEAGSSSSEGADRVSSVWSLLAKAGQGDAHKCLKKVGVNFAIGGFGWRGMVSWLD